MSSSEEFGSKCIALGLRVCLLDFLSEPSSKSFLKKSQPMWLRSFNHLIPDSTGYVFERRIGLDHQLSKRQEVEWSRAWSMDGLGSQTSLNLSPGSLTYWLELLKPTFHQVPHLQNGNDSASHRIVVRIKENVHAECLAEQRTLFCCHDSTWPSALVHFLQH